MTDSLLAVRYVDGRIKFFTAKKAALEVASPDAIALRYQRAGRLPRGRIVAAIMAPYTGGSFAAGGTTVRRLIERGSRSATHTTAPNNAAVATRMASEGIKEPIGPSI